METHAWQNCTETHGITVRKRTIGPPANMCLTQVTEIETVTAEGDCRHLQTVITNHQSSHVYCVNLFSLSAGLS